MPDKTPLQEAAKRHILSTWTPLSAQVDSTTQTMSPDHMPENHVKFVDKWVDGLRQMEEVYVPDAIERVDVVPIVATHMVSVAFSAFMRQSMSYMGALAGTYKAYIQLYGPTDAQLKQFTDALIVAVQGMCAVSIDAMAASLHMRPDNQVPTEEGTEPPPAIEMWMKRFEEMSQIWQDTLGANPDPAKLAEYAIKYQAALVTYAKRVRPDVMQGRDGPLTPEDIERFAQQTGIPAERLEELLAGAKAGEDPLAKPGGEADPATPPAEEQSTAKED